MYNGNGTGAAYGRKKLIPALLAVIVSLAFCGCSGESGEAAVSGEEVAIAASFRQEGGGALHGDTVRFSYGENSAERPLDEDGKTKITGLPRTGDLKLTVLDRQAKARGAMTLSLSEGAVIDAATDDSGVGHVTLRRDMDEVALVFVLGDDGALRCSLWSTQPDSPNLSQEE